MANECYFLTLKGKAIYRRLSGKKVIGSFIKNIVNILIQHFPYNVRFPIICRKRLITIGS